MHPETTRSNTSDAAGAKTPSAAAVIELERVSVTSADTGTTLLASTTLRVRAGQVAVLRGENGSGKTTLLRVLAGRTAPSTGSVRIWGRPVDERDPAFRRHAAAMIGLHPMAPDLTVRDHVALVSATWYGTSERALRATETTLEELGFTALGKKFPNELSSGQTQLFGLALVLVRPFEVLLLDEPEQRLDPGRIALLADVILTRRRAGATIVVATHSEILARRIAGQTLLLPGAA